MTTNGNVLLEILGIFVLLSFREHCKVNSCGVLTVPCKPPCLIVSTTTEIVALDFDNDTSSPIVSGLSRVVALDIHFSLGYIFWTDVAKRNIKKSCIDGTNVTIIHSGTGVCDGLAVEWMRNQLYWTDTTDDVIRVSDLEGKNTRILISLGLDEPRGIVLDPERGSMFWTDWGAAPKIETAALNGTERVTLVNTGLRWPNGITLDRKRMLVFWVDAGKDRLESINYDGNNRTLLFVRVNFHLFGVTFNSPYIFVSEWDFKSVYKMNISSGTIAGTHYFGGPNKIMGIVPYDSSWQRRAITCPALPSLTNGARLGCSGNATEFFYTVCQFTCSDGYAGSGSPERKCQQNGTWSGQEFVCEIITCLGLPSPTNGTRAGCSGNATEFYDTVCQFGCNDGYVGTGSQVRRCQENGTWSGQGFVCEIINCTSLTIDPGGPLRMGNCGNHYGEKCNFSCPIGYRINGSSELTCVAPGNQHPGVWNNSLPTCEAITCPGLHPPTNGTRLGCSGNATEFYDTVCHFGCSNGYIGSGSQSRRCQQNGTWSGREFVCEIINCTSLTIDSGGPLRMGNCGNHYEEKCNFSCPIGYRLNGSSELFCVAPGNKHPGVWNNSIPTCEAITCPGLHSPTNGTRIGCSGNATEFYDTACQFGCYNGYIGSGSQSRRCQQNGTWSGQEFLCAIINCTSLTIDPGGPLRIGNCGYHYGVKCNFSCPIGYRLNGSSELTCVAPGNKHPGVWNNSLPTCEAITCPGLSPPINGTRIGCSGNETEYYDTVCQFTCTNGFIGSGSQFRKCQQNGTWSGQEFFCEIINCTSLTVDPGGPLRMGYCGNQHGTKCNFSCPIGYRLNGSSVITCVSPGNQHPGVWNDVLPTCEVAMCPVPMPPANSVRDGCIGNATEYPYNTECQFSCIEGYTPNGSSLRKCQDNGLWSGGEEFHCERILCESLQLPPMRTNGSCNRLPGSACQFTCERGFNLIGSAVRWCNKDGSWTGTRPRCEVVACPMLSLPTNGVLLGCNTNTTEMLYGSECRFSCEDRSVATGSTVRRCTENATWTGTDLECTGIKSDNTWNHENGKNYHKRILHTFSVRVLDH